MNIYLKSHQLFSQHDLESSNANLNTLEGSFFLGTIKGQKAKRKPRPEGPWGH